MTAVQPALKTEVDLTGNPSAGYFDQLRYADGLVSYWRFNATGSFVDELGANTGTMEGTPTLVTGALPNDTDQALQFNGSSNDAYAPDSPTLSPSAFSLEAWVKVASLPASTKDLVAKRGSFLLQIDSAGKLLFAVKKDTTVTTVQSGAGISTGTYYHVACVYDGQTARIYINGILDQSASHTVGLETTTQPLRFAAWRGTTSPAWQSSTTGTVNGTALVINTPASTGAGDLLIAHIESVQEASTLTPPAGWTLIANVGQASQHRTRVFAKIATASEPASYTFTAGTTGIWHGAISRITGADPITPYANPAYTAEVNSSSHPTGSHLPNLDNTLILALFAGRTTNTWTEDSGTERYDFNGGAGTSSIAMCSQTQATAAAINVTGTQTGGDWGSAILLVIGGTGLNYTACTLDEASFWNVALTADQVRTHYEARLGGVGSWTDITADVVTVQTRSGRQYELDRVGASTSMSTMDDTARSLDPANSSSGYAPNVIPLRKIRHRADINSILYARFRGFIDRLPSEYAGDHQALQIGAIDALEPLGFAGVNGTIPAGLSGTQIHALLDKAGWPRADRAIDAGQFTMAAVALSTTAKALSEIQAIAESELGIFFIDAAGVATFHDFAHRWTSSRSITSQATFSNANDSNIPYVPELLKPSLDKERIVNDWTVITADGTTRTAVDALSISKFFRRSNTRSTRLDDPADAQKVATMLLQQTANPALRIDSMTVQPIDTTVWQTVLGLKISDRITVIKAPAAAGGGSTSTKDYFIEGIADTVPAVDSGALWSVVFQLSPCNPSSYYETALRYVPVSYWRMNTVT